VLIQLETAKACLEVGRGLALLPRRHIQPLWTPTKASWLNQIEAQFGMLRRFTVANTDGPNHGTRRHWVQIRSASASLQR
jgi:hypothetical protein